MLVKRLVNLYSSVMANIILQLKKKLNGTTQVALAADIGVSPPHLCAVLKGRKPAGSKIRKYLGFEKQVTYRKRKLQT